MHLPAMPGAGRVHQMDSIAGCGRAIRVTSYLGDVGMSIERTIVLRLEQTDLTLEIDSTYRTVILKDNGKEIADLTPKEKKAEFMRELSALFLEAALELDVML